MRSDQTRTYERASSVVFLKTDEPFGGLSNMAGGFPLKVNGVRILTSEALYQACRFPHLPKIQKLIIEQRSPMTAKMKSKPFRRDSRSDWDQVRIKIMRWCLRVKLAQNWRPFSELLLKTGDRPIVEESRKDDFWGAKPVDDHTLIGMNVLGRLLMELREAVKVESQDLFLRVEPIVIPEFLFAGRPIEAVFPQEAGGTAIMAQPALNLSCDDVRGRELVQPSLFCGNVEKESVTHAHPNENAKGLCIADLKPYSEYKATLQAWLGDVPQHWSVVPNRALFSEVKDRNHPDEEMLSVTITRGIVRQKVLLAGSSKKDSSKQDKSAYKLVQPHDIAYNKMRAWQGAIGASDFRGIISPAYVVMRLREEAQLPRYFHHLYRTPQFAKEAERWSYGITSDMWSLRPEHFKMIYTPQPPPSEQAAIVRFLDWANEWLERAIRAKQKVIALLNEQKQAIIHRAVTRGLDPSVPLKPSGIPWLGDIPKHWEVTPIKQLLSRMDYGTSENARGQGKVRVLTMGHIRDGKVVLPEKGGLDEVPPGLLLVKNDLLFNRTNSPELVGKVGLFAGEAENEVTFASYLVRLRARSEHSPMWLNYSLNSSAFWAFARSQALVSLHQANLNSRRYGQMVIPVPPQRTEQDEIVEHVQSQVGEIELTISRLEREIELLREYRTRLVADVVTGKLDVRDAAGHLPEEAAPDTAEESVEDIDETETVDEEIVV